MSYLKRLPLGQSKTDLSFMRDILMDACSGAIAQTIVFLGDAMGLPVQAEDGDERYCVKECCDRSQWRPRRRVARLVRQ